MDGDETTHEMKQDATCILKNERLAEWQITISYWRSSASSASDSALMLTMCALQMLVLLLLLLV